MIYYIENDPANAFVIGEHLKTLNLPSLGFFEPISFFTQLNLDSPQLLLINPLAFTQSTLETLKQILKGKPNLDVIIILKELNTVNQHLINDLNVTKTIQTPISFAAFKNTLIDYLKKPQNATIAYGGITVKTDEKKVSLNGTNIHLTNHEYDILVLLLTNPHETVSRDFIIKVLWRGELKNTTRTIDVHISALRRKLKHANLRILTIYGDGYRISKT